MRFCLTLLLYLVFTSVAAADKPEVCRAFVNLPGDTFADVRFEEGRAVVDYGAGAVVRDGADVYRVWLEDRSRRGKSISESWQVMLAQKLGSSAVKTLMDGDPNLDSPDGEDGMEYDGSHSVSVEGTVGPYISAYIMAGGFAGGAHGYDDTRYTTLHVTGKAVKAADLLDAGAVADVKHAMTRDAAARKKHDREFMGDPPMIKSIQEIRAFAVAYGRKADPSKAEVFTEDMSGPSVPPVPGPGLLLKVSLDCCTWVENHNTYFASVPLQKNPAALAPFADKAGRLPGPAACPAYDLQSGAFYQGTTRVPGFEAQAVGVSWVRRGDALSTVMSGNAKALKARHDAGRKYMKAGNLAAAATSFTSAIRLSKSPGGLYGELGWARFTQGDLAAAETATRQALTHLAPADQGAVIYNLGRIAEAQKKQEDAIGHYRASLKVRRNKTVEKRLKTLEAMKP